MKFSVLIANYNNEAYFEDCYQSLINQNYKNWEAVVLDDGSKKESLEKIKAIVGDDNRFRFFENESNKGVGITKARLIEIAEGDICGFVDPDDAILSSAIESAINVYQKKKDVVLTYSRFMQCDENLKPISPFKGARQVPNNDPYFFNYPIQIAHFVTFKKSVYETTDKMNTNLKIAEDQDLYLKMYEKGKVKFIPETDYYYRNHSEGISQNENKEKSYQYFGEVVYNAMKRRGLQSINGKAIPDEYPGYQEIFALLEYQNGIGYRIQKKLKTLIS